MTIAMTPAGPALDPTVSWRALEGGLWVARRSGRHLGSVQQGRRWTAADGDGEPIGVYRTLREAQDAVADPDARPVPVRSASAVPSVVAIVSLGFAAVVSGTGWALTSLLA